MTHVTQTWCAWWAESWSPDDVHVRVPGTCVHVTFHGRDERHLQVEVRLESVEFRIGRLLQITRVGPASSQAPSRGGQQGKKHGKDSAHLLAWRTDEGGA